LEEEGDFAKKGLCALNLDLEKMFAVLKCRVLNFALGGPSPAVARMSFRRGD
jgi:hypothetical protein